MADTVKVRIRVCVDEKGNWFADGYGNPDETVHRCDEDMVDGMPDDHGAIAFHTIEAEVPLPKPLPASTTIQGNVVQEAQEWLS